MRKSFGKRSSWWSELVKENITATLKDIILGLLNRTAVINYLIILGNSVFGNVGKPVSILILTFFLKK